MQSIGKIRMHFNKSCRCHCCQGPPRPQGNPSTYSASFKNAIKLRLFSKGVAVGLPRSSRDPIWHFTSTLQSPRRIFASSNSRSSSSKVSMFKFFLSHCHELYIRIKADIGKLLPSGPDPVLQLGPVNVFRGSQPANGFFRMRFT